MKDKLFPYLTGVLLVGLAIVAVRAFSIHYKLPTQVAFQSDIASAVQKVQGTGPVAGCDAAITAAVLSSGGDKPSFGLPVIRSDGAAEDVYVHINSNIYHGWAECKVQKSIWQVLGNSPSGPPPQGNKPPS